MISTANKICHLIDSNLGSEFFRSIARLHDRDHFPVIIGSLAPTGRLQSLMQELDTPTFSLNTASRWYYPMAVLQLVRLLQRERVSVLHAHCFDPTLVGGLAARMARVSFVFTRHHSDHHIRINKHWHTRIDGWCARKADHVLAVSHITKQLMVEIERVPAQQITVVYNGMEPLREPTTEGLARVRQELGLADERICLMIARLHEEKGHRYLFKAIPSILKRCGRVVFLLAGEGPHRTTLEAEIQARGLQNTVRFLGQRKDIPELIALASVVTLPSLAESFGYAALEAMSMGKPVVVAATGGLLEVVSNDETGLIVPQADAQSLAQAMGRILQDEDLAMRLGSAGRVRAREFTFEKMLRGYEAVYQRFSNQGRTPSKVNALPETPIASRNFQQ
jgi:glycosyltransferase involved in cell wall biosynthesis